MIDKELNKFTKETILKALGNSWLTIEQLNDFIDCCYEIELDKVYKEQEKLLKNSPKKPISRDFRSTVKYMSEVQKHFYKSEKYSKKIDKLCEERRKHWEEKK